MKRGQSGLSLVIGVDKPQGLTSHDVVSRCRRIFGERRVGHTGTLDPLATGAMLVCVGPATRLDAFFVDHDKRYRARIAFGVGTDTDDAAGIPTSFGVVPPRLEDEEFAARYIEGIVGPHKQMPPVYSALKVGGKKACDEARRGHVIDLAPRDIEIYDATLAAIGRTAEVQSSPDEGCPTGLTELVDDVPAATDVPQSEAAFSNLLFWDVDLHVSKGTYVRSIARDIGRALGCPAHISALRRLSSGSLSIEDCVTLETLEEIGTRAAIDPVPLLGCRFAYADGPLAKRCANGAVFKEGELALCERRRSDARSALCACTSGVRDSCEPAHDGETVAVIVDNRLAAVYCYSGDTHRFKPRCVFQKGVSRGEYL